MSVKKQHRANYHCVRAHCMYSTGHTATMHERTICTAQGKLPLCTSAILQHVRQNATVLKHTTEQHDICDGAANLGWRSVPHGDLVTAAQQIGDHATAHNAQTQEANLGGRGDDVVFRQQFIARERVVTLSSFTLLQIVTLDICTWIRIAKRASALR